MLEEFSDHQMIEAIYTAARNTARDYPYLLHQMGIYEMSRINGNLNKAREHLQKAQSLAHFDKTITHSIAELELRKAEIAGSELEFRTLVRTAEQLARPLANSNAVDSHGFHTLAKINLSKIRRLVVNRDRKTGMTWSSVRQSSKLRGS